MNIFRLFENEKFRKIYSKTHQIVPFKKTIRGSMPPNPPSKRLATSRVASPPPKKKKVGPLGKSCIRPWTTTEKFT